jgi:hypothetical protein
VIEEKKEAEEVEETRLEEIPLVSQEQMDKLTEGAKVLEVSATSDESPDMVRENEEEAVPFIVVPNLLRINVGHKKGVKKGYLESVIDQVKPLVLKEMKVRWVEMGGPFIKPSDPFGLVMQMKEQFMVGLGDHLREHAEWKAGEHFDFPKDLTGINEVEQLLERVMEGAVNRAFQKLKMAAALEEAKWEDNRSYAGWIVASWAWQKSSEDISEPKNEVN